MKNKWARRLCSVALSAAMLYTISFPVHGEEKTTITSIQENKDIPAIEVSSSTLLDADKKPVPIGSSQEISEEELLDRIEKGEATAVKSGVFVSDNDALNGIVQITFQIAGKENQSDKPINVMLILDQTGSMNMYCAENSVYMMDCLNHDHYYYIPAGTFGNHGGGYVRIADFNPEGPGFNSWYGQDEEGRNYIPNWVVQMLNTLPSAVTEDNAQNNQKDDENQNHPDAGQSEKNSETRKAEGNEQKSQEESEDPVNQPVQSSDLTAESTQLTDLSSTESDVNQNQNTPSESSVNDPDKPADQIQNPQPSAEGGQSSAAQSAQPQTVTEQVEEWVEVPQEPEYQTVTETVMVCPEPYTVEETEMQMVTPDPVFNKETGEMEQGEPSMQEVKVSRTVTPEPYETTVEKQVLIDKEPVYRKVIRTVEKPLEQTEAVNQAVSVSQQPTDFSASDGSASKPVIEQASVQAEQSLSESDITLAASDNPDESADPEHTSRQQTDSSKDPDSVSEQTESQEPAEQKNNQIEKAVTDRSSSSSASQSSEVSETAEIDLYSPVFDSGYHVDDASIMQWKPNDHHYRLVDGQFEQIEQPAYAAQSLNGQTLNYLYYSPAENNPAGCVDRALLQKQYVRSFVQNVLTENPENKIAIELFNNDTDQVLRTDFTSDYSRLLPALSFTQGASNTNYELAFNTASEIISDSEGFMKNCDLYTIFVSDGLPNCAVMTPQPEDEDEYKKFGNFFEYAGYTAAKDYRQKYPQTLYAVGLQTNIRSYFSRLASDPEYALDCATMDQFNAFLKYVQSTWQKAHPDHGILEDVVAEGFSLLIDEDHPFRFDETDYAAVADLPEEVSVDGQTIRISLGKLTERQRKVSFFVQASPELLRNDQQWIDLPTNAKAELSYSPVIIDQNQNIALGETESVGMNSPFVRFGYSQITAVKSSSAENEPLYPNDEITYTITVKNEGLNDLKHMQIADPLPEGTEYVSGGEFADGRIHFSVDDLKAGTSRQYSFTVRIREDALDLGIDRIENTGYFGTEPGEDGIPDLPTNPVENPLRPVPEPQPEPQKPTQPEFMKPNPSKTPLATATVFHEQTFRILGLAAAGIGLCLLTAERKRRVNRESKK